MKKQPLIIIGAGGHGRVVADIATLNGYDHISFLDDVDVSRMNVVGRISDFTKFIDNHDFFVAIGNNAVRKSFFDMVRTAGGTVATLCHPSAVFGSDVKLGQGVAAMAGVVVNNGATIGDGVILNTCCSVDHDCQIGSFAHISIGTHLAGTVSVGECTFIGAGAPVVNNITICKKCMIGAGALVVKNIIESGTYVGVPSKHI